MRRIHLDRRVTSAKRHPFAARSGLEKGGGKSNLVALRQSSGPYNFLNQCKGVRIRDNAFRVRSVPIVHLPEPGSGRERRREGRICVTFQGKFRVIM